MANRTVTFMTLSFPLACALGCGTAPSDETAMGENEATPARADSDLFRAQPGRVGRVVAAEQRDSIALSAREAKQIVRTAQIDGMTIPYVVDDGQAIAGGDMILGPVDAEGNLVLRGHEPVAGEETSEQAPRGSKGGSNLIGRGEEIDKRPCPPPATGTCDIEVPFIVVNGRKVLVKRPGWMWNAKDFGPQGVGGCDVPYSIGFTRESAPMEFDSVRDAVASMNQRTFCKWRETPPEPGNGHVTFTINRTIKDYGRSNVGRTCWWTKIPGAIDWNLNCMDQPIELNCDKPSIFSPFTQAATAVFCRVSTKHEMMHALGFWHEHQRPDRDQFMEVVGDIDPASFATNFATFAFDQNHQVWGRAHYDIYSLTHYGSVCTFIPLPGVGWECFPKNGLRTKAVLLPVPFEGQITSGGIELSTIDLQSLAAMYPPPPGSKPPPPMGNSCANSPPEACRRIDSPECCDVWSRYQPESNWQPGASYTANQQVMFNVRWYRVLQSHVSLAGWDPEHAPSLFAGVAIQGDAWLPNTEYQAGSVATFGGTRYNIIQPHTSAAGWEPPNTPALWKPLPAMP
jgi:hypothetical protein